MDESSKKSFVHGGLNESMLKPDTSLTYTYMNKDSTLIVKGYDRTQKAAVRKLICVSFVCVIFMLVEIIGGYIANSLSIMTDAAHMFSDLCGFGISMGSLIIAKKTATRSMSYGFHRSEVVGASLSVLLIWGLTIWLIVEAVKRIINPEEVDGLIMLVVAGAGLLSNIIMGKILHSHGGHEDHRVLTHIILHPEDAPRLTSLRRDGGLLSAQSRQKLAQELHDHEHHDHEHHDHEHHDHEHHDHEHHDHEHHDHDHEHHDHHHEHEGHDHKHSDHKHGKGKGHDHGHAHEHGHSHFGHHHGHDHGNMNLRAALIHVIGDLCQSIGVCIAGLIIFLKPDLHIIDPICTFLFSIIVFMTTVPIMKDCVRIIMEATPLEIDTEAMIHELKTAEGVIEVHDLHVWTLSMGKYALTCHIISTNPERSLIACTQICQETYDIKHITLQVEKSTNNYDLQCSVGLHSKYID